MQLELVQIVGNGKGSAPGQFQKPKYLAQTSDKKAVVVTDCENRRLHVISVSGLCLRMVPLNFMPRCVALADPDGTFWVGSDDREELYLASVHVAEASQHILSQTRRIIMAGGTLKGEQSQRQGADVKSIYGLGRWNRMLVVADFLANKVHLLSHDGLVVESVVVSSPDAVAVAGGGGPVWTSAGKTGVARSLFSSASKSVDLTTSLSKIGIASRL
jgi:hypothetical protein